MNSSHHPHDVHQQRLLWFFSFCNQRSSSSSSSSNGSGSTRRVCSRRKSASNRNKFALQYQHQLQQQQRQSSNVFGCDLIEHTRTYSDEDSVPHIVKACTRFIEKHGIIFGIYRLSGMRVNIHKLRQDFDKNPKISMIDSEAISNDAHAVACVLKQYFRELPTPLLTFHMYEKLIELFKHSNTIDKTTNNEYSCNIGTTNYQPKTTEHDNNNTSCGNVSTDSLTTTATNKSTSSQMTTKSKSSTSAQQQHHHNHHHNHHRHHHHQSTAAIATQAKKQSQFTTSVSDSQLISLSSVVTTTTPDVKYHVKLEDLRQLLIQLPKPHYQTLKFLMCHLACIAANGQKTGMDSKNVAIVWAPNLLKPRELELSAGLETLQIIGLQAVITEQLIKHHKFLFREDDIEENLICATNNDGHEVVDIERVDGVTEISVRDYDQQTQDCQTQSPPKLLPQQQQQLEPVHKDQDETTTQRDVDKIDKEEENENNF